MRSSATSSRRSGSRGTRSEPPVTGRCDPSVHVAEEVVEPAPVQALAALFDDGLPTPRRGDVLPPLWHWAALAAWPGSRATGPDGHAAVGGFLPDVGKPRRMFAGGSVRFDGVLVVGEPQVRAPGRLRARRRRDRGPGPGRETRPRRAAGPGLPRPGDARRHPGRSRAAPDDAGVA